MEFKIGDKVKIPTQSTANIGNYKQACNQMAGYELDYLVITDLNTCKNPNWEVGLDMDSGKTLFANAFNFIDIELYEEKQETMKNLLETEFVIENCTLSQRLAIKAYCDEKKIKYVDLEVPSYKTLTFSEGKFKGFINSVVQRDVITFSELIQFLDKYQPEPEFKVGDFVYFDGKHHQAGPYLLKEKISDGQFKDSNNETRNIKESKGAYRYATPEEIKKWKEENEIKLPKISDYNGLVTRSDREVFLNWGCTQVSISTVKELLKLKTSSITIGNVHLDNVLIQQIKKFIEHNKL